MYAFPRFMQSSLPLKEMKFGDRQQAGSACCQLNVAFLLDLHRKT
jgi:hypothetical protein